MEPYEGAEPYIFISYARRNSERVTPLLEALTGAGWRVWWDKGIEAGAHWTETLVEKVEDCAVFCPLFSEAFNVSRFCFEETDYAYRKDKTIVPVFLEEPGEMEPRPLYRLLQARQDLRLYEYADAAKFVERLGREPAFASCKVPEWHKIGQIQWRFSESDGVLTIARNEDLPPLYHYAVIPPYQRDPIHGGSTAPWMPYREQIRSVMIANDIIEIGKHAFENCNHLTDARIPDSISNIGNFAFEGCRSLKTVRMEKGVKTISDFAFHSCASLTEVRIPDSVTKIGSLAFACCYRLTNVRLSNHVTEIGDDAFMDCKSLTVAHIPESMTKINGGTFYGCENLRNARIPDSVTQIGVWAFWGCDSLKSVEIPAGATFVESGELSSFPENTLVIRRAAPDS